MTTEEKILEYLYENENDKPIDLTGFIKQLGIDESDKLRVLLQLKMNHAYINRMGNGDCEMYLGKIKPEGKLYFLALRAATNPRTQQPQTKDEITNMASQINLQVVQTVVGIVAVIIAAIGLIALIK